MSKVTTTLMVALLTLLATAGGAQADGSPFRDWGRGRFGPIRLDLSVGAGRVDNLHDPYLQPNAYPAFIGGARAEIDLCGLAAIGEAEIGVGSRHRITLRADVIGRLFPLLGNGDLCPLLGLSLGPQIQMSWAREDSRLPGAPPSLAEDGLALGIGGSIPMMPWMGGLVGGGGELTVTKETLEASLTLAFFPLGRQPLVKGGFGTPYLGAKLTWRNIRWDGGYELAGNTTLPAQGIFALVAGVVILQ